MSCTACAARIERALGKMDGVRQVSVSYASRMAWIRFDPLLQQPARIVERIGQLGFRAVGTEGAGVSFDEAARLQMRLIVSALFSLPLLWSMADHVPLLGLLPMPPLFRNLWFQLAIASVIQFGIGMPFYIGAWNALRERTANMDVLVAVGTTAAYLYSHYMVFAFIRESGGFRLTSGSHPAVYFETPAVVITALLLGKYMESRIAARALRETEGYGGLRSKEAVIVRAGSRRSVPLAEVRVGDHVMAEAGAKIPVDGVVLEGEAEADESLLTGESRPVRKRTGAEVWAGTVLIGGTLRIRTEAVQAGTMLDRIHGLLKRAQASKSTVQRRVDRISVIFVPAMLTLSVLTFAGNWLWFAPGETDRALLRSLAVLLAACPCALGLAAPISLVIASGRLARRGIVVKDAGALERLAHLDTLVLDKTGTLTEGKPNLSAVKPLAVSETALLRLAAAAESASPHPFAKAIVDAAASRGLVPPSSTGIRELPGYGITAQVEGRQIGIGSAKFMEDQQWTGLEALQLFARKHEDAGATVLYVAADGRCLGAFAFSDKVKDSSERAVAWLRKAGLDVHLATGDHKAPALAAAETAGIGSVHASMTPERKFALVESLKREGRVTAMAGDGWNDAPALAAADVGFALGSGARAALEAGHLTLLRPRLTGICQAIAISRLTLRNIRQNLAFALLYNMMIVPLAVCGLLQPWMAGGAMALSSLSVVCNALRLGRLIDRKLKENSAE
ncbi:hypothetical protein VN24_21345 [Paenibacillus beijingensis]|uniref:P-type Cu(+) transporter n=2 Tax=Paenibacillus beijingensis TaxID=1126833 RepID=A0A0D5NRJ6_9BACL|nr:hypothetical protein VN24_21345 [Paenibacillus beijingensis]